jgi:AcrR family transcriptional regulator
MPPGQTRVERAAATRAALVDSARTLFTERGCSLTGTEEIVSAAGVGTRGALYHHFPDKEALFEAVFEVIQAELGDEILASLPDTPADALSMLEEMLTTFLDRVVKRRDAQVLLMDGPAVLGWQRFRQVVVRFGLVPIHGHLVTAMADGIIADQPIAPLAHLILGLAEDAARYVAQADDRDGARLEVSGALVHLLEGLRVSG